ncbi:MAG: aldehyde dehydrogenase [Planctomycetota bacterium]
MSSSSMLASFNPATGEKVGEVRITPEEQVPAVVARAQAAQPGWGRRSFEERIDALSRAGERLVARCDELGELLTREMGKPLREGRGEVKACGAGMRKSAEEIAAALAPEVLEDENTRSRIYHDPFGVCAAITPWNFPMAMPHSLVIPALVAGNAVVLKPSEETPLIAQAYVDVLNEFLPADVLQIVHGADAQGRALVAADVDLIAFTGSRETGKKIMAAAAGGLKRLILELGGKDAMIVLADADLEQAAKFAAMNSFRNAGQVCVSTERILVDSRVADAFAQKVAEFARTMKVGDGLQDGVQMGPMVNQRQKDHVTRQVSAAVRHGARVVAGGDGHHDNFFQPTVLVDVRPDMDIMKEETFGPVACIARFDDVDEAVRLANDTPFGLGATVFGDPAGAALDVARRLDAGMIGVNKSCGGASGAPWVGAKESGYGFHSSTAGHRQFAQTRVVSVPR